MSVVSTMTGISNGTEKKENKDFEYKVKAAILLSGFSAMSVFLGFTYAVAAAKKSNPDVYEQGIHNSRILQSSSSLALKALGIGTLLSITGVSSICLLAWKLSGANNMNEFKLKMESMFPNIKKNNPPEGRTEFSSLTDLLQYLISKDKKN